jgi:hypothetical protein
MLKIRDEQMAAFEGDARKRFVERLVARIEANFPEKYGKMGPDGTQKYVEDAIKKAETYQIRTQSAVIMLIELMLNFGDNFELSPDRQWAQNMMKHPTLTDDVKLTAMRDRMTARSGGRRIIVV